MLYRPDSLIQFSCSGVMLGMILLTSSRFNVEYSFPVNVKNKSVRFGNAVRRPHGFRAGYAPPAAMVPSAGIEPAVCCLRGSCSGQYELKRHEKTTMEPFQGS